MLIDEFAEYQQLNEAIDTLLTKINGTEPSEDIYSQLIDQLTKLTKIKQIIVDTKLKDFSEEEKAFQFRQNHELKDRELTVKAIESERTQALKQKELANRVEADDLDRALRSREIDIKESDAAKPDRVSRDALVAAGASIAGILLIINYEKANVIASKALGFVLKR